MRERLPDLPVPPEIEPAQARFRLFDSFTTFLQNASHSHPLVLIVDDLQWADKPSLLLLHFLARAISATRLLILGTYSDIEVGRAHPLAEVLGGLARESQRLVLQGLAEGEVARFIENTTGTKPEARLVTAVYKKTEGNPFFMSEIVRLLAAEGRLQSLQGATVESITIPEGVRETIRRRLERLSAGCNRLLATAAVIGREFGLDLLAQAGQECTEADRSRLLALLEEALTAHLVDAVPGRVDRYRFAHALIREALYDDLSLTDRISLHRHVGEALETLYAGYLRPYFAELADHFFKAASGSAPEKAVHYAIQAGERATALLAYEEAVEHYERALQALALRVVNEAQRCDLLLALGGAQAKWSAFRNTCRVARP